MDHGVMVISLCVREEHKGSRICCAPSAAVRFSHLRLCCNEYVNEYVVSTWLLKASQARAERAEGAG